MPFTVAVVYFSRHGRLVTLANVVAEGARSVPGADVEVYRVPDPLNERAGAILESPREEGGGGGGEAAAAAAATAPSSSEAAASDQQQRPPSSSSPAPPPPPPPTLSSSYDDGVLDAPVATPATLAAADVILLGAPARQGGMCGEMRLFLDSLAPAAEAMGARGNAAAAAAQKDGGAGSGGVPSRASAASPPPPSTCLPAVSLRGKVGAAFTAIGGPARGHGGAESVLSSFHATFLSHGMVVVGAPPSPMMDRTPGGTPLGAVASGGGEEERRSAASVAAAAAAAAAGTSSSSSSSAAAAAILASQHVTLSGTEVRLGYSLGQWAAQVGALLHGDDDGGGGGCE